MKLKKSVPYLVIFLIVILIIALTVILLPSNLAPTIGTRKAIILSSANDFYRKESEDDFNNGDDAKFSTDGGRWIQNFTNGYGGQSDLPGHDGFLGLVQLIANTFPNPNGIVNIEYIYNWTKYYTLFKYAMYYFSVWVNIPTQVGTPGVRIGLRWLNSSNGVIRTDWSSGIFTTFGIWTFLNITGIADNSTSSDITQLYLILSVNGNMTHNDMVFFDDVRVEYWFPPPIPIPPPSNMDSDGFPAQALQVYWVLKNHGYTDDNIFLMLYHTGDNIIDINAFDPYPNDLNRSGTLAEVDVENDDVNASRFKLELNVSISSSFASSIQSNDQLIIYMVDHGSNKILGDGNATFHFEADDSYITELEFFNLVKQIKCERMLINIDICFSGNFLNQDTNIGLSWFNIPNSILITSTTNILSWYWRNNNNPDGFAGSWFFHQFWDQLNQSQTIGAAFNYAINFVPSGYLKSINEIQTPLIQDNLGIKDIWSFTSNPPL